MKFTELLIILILAFIFSSCSHFDRIFFPNKYIKIEDYINEDYDISKSDVISFDNQGQINVEFGKRPEEIIVLNSIGDEGKVKVGQPFILEFSNLDLNNSMFITESSPIHNYVTLKVKRKYEEINFIDKCQTIEVYNVDFIPLINVENSLKHQVIVTPIFSKNSDLKCNLIGYQIRYGDQEHAQCRKEAGKIYELFKECTYGKSQVVPLKKNDALKILFKQKKK